MDQPLPESVISRIRKLEEEIKTIKLQHEKTAKKNLEKYRRVLDATSEGFLELDLEFNIIDYNTAIEELTGRSGKTLLQTPVDDLYDKRSVFVHFADKNHLSFEAVFYNQTGEDRILLYKRSVLRDKSGLPNGFLVFLTELTELKKAQDDLKVVETRYKNIYKNAAQGMYQCRLDGTIVRVNPAFAKIFGYEQTTELIKNIPNIRTLYKTTNDRLQFVSELTHNRVITNYEMEMLHRDGKSVWVMINARLTEESEGPPLIDGILIDNTKKRMAQIKLHRSRERFRHLANHDSLTGLFNTRYLYKSLDKLTAESDETREPFSLVFLDMDNFKHIVDTYGHLNGSQALKEVAETFKQCLVNRSFGVAYGGDEFVLVLPQTEKKEALTIVEKIRNLMKNTVYLRKKDLKVKMSASFGVAVYPDDADDSVGLLALADEAMFHVKSSGKNAVGISSDI
ncbi:sensor domain-containing diguanylate cyclase [Desulforhopalus sp. 52FAK]